jgi:drug/metabolite transporter (DMT)-like permease
MDLDKIKSNWKETGVGKKNQNELLVMTKIKNHPNIKNIKIKFFIEFVLLIVFVVVYYDGFDGETKPLWANILLVSSAAVYILNRFIGWLILRSPVKESNLKDSLKSFQYYLKRMALFTLLTSLLFGSSIILFFSTTIDFTKDKKIALAAMIVSLILLVFLSGRNWIKRVKEINYTLSELRETLD